MNCHRLKHSLLAVSEIKGAPAPGAHISTDGSTIFGGVHPVCARFLSYLLLLYIGRVHRAISGCTVLGEVHPVSAQNKSLISEIAYMNNIGLYEVIIMRMVEGCMLLPL